VASSVVGYDACNRNVGAEEHPMEGKKLDHEQSEETKQSHWGFRGKTLWNWLELLIVPLALAIIGLLFAWQQDTRQRELEEQRAQDAALQAYLDQMSTLILDKNLLESEQGNPTYTLAQARTATVMARLDAARNSSVMRFLSDSGLASSLLRGITLEGVDLRDVDLVGADADLSDANLSDANLIGARLQNVDLSEANLIGADLSATLLAGADLSATFLSDADLSGAFLLDADLSGTMAEDSNLSGAVLRDADLTYAYLTNADLTNADLDGVILQEPPRSDPWDHSVAILDGADLTGAFITQENLEKLAQTQSLDGATMPDRQPLKSDDCPNCPTFEEWLKDK
jgi:uncharacterized protein YjbI with pentapeptide repeats